MENSSSESQGNSNSVLPLHVNELRRQRAEQLGTIVTHIIRDLFAISVSCSSPTLSSWEEAIALTERTGTGCERIRELVQELEKLSVLLITTSVKPSSLLPMPTHASTMMD